MDRLEQVLRRRQDVDRLWLLIRNHPLVIGVDCVSWDAKTRCRLLGFLLDQIANGDQLNVWEACQGGVMVPVAHFPCANQRDSGPSCGHCISSDCASAVELDGEGD